MIKVYHRPHNMKRGNKLGEFPRDFTLKQFWEWLEENHKEYTTHPIQRHWVRDGKTIIDYGSYRAYIVIHKTWEEEY